MTRLKKLLWTALGLLFIAILVNCVLYRHSVLRVLRRESRLPAEMAYHFGTPKPMQPVGSIQAKVQIRAMLMSANHCHQPTLETLTKVAQSVPSRVRVVFIETGSVLTSATTAQGQVAGCMADLSINGKREMDVRTEKGKMHISFHGPLGMGTPFDWFRMAVEKELALQYPKGLTAQEKKSLAAVWSSFQQNPPAMRRAETTTSSFGKSRSLTGHGE